MQCHHLHGPVHPGRGLHIMCPFSFVLTLVSSMLWRHPHKHKALSDRCFRNEHMPCASTCMWLIKRVAEAMVWVSLNVSIHTAVELLLQGVTVKLSSMFSCLSLHSSHGS